MARLAPRIAVVGSLNVDLIASVDRLPCAGETISSHRLVRRFGGKGANQAVAAARQGARVSMIGCVGDDADGASYCAHLDRERITAVGVGTARLTPTGTALIAVDRDGENLIVVAPGANRALTPTAVRAARRAIEGASALLVQLEVPLPAVLEAIRIASRAEVPVVFTPAPWRVDFPWGRQRIDFVLVNEHEAGTLLGRTPNDTLARAHRRVVPKLESLGIRTLIVTRGAESTLCFSPAEAFAVPTMPVKPIDTVGAGDAFAATFATALASGFSVRGAIVRGNCAGALATLKCGAQEALPTAAQVERAARKMTSG